MAPTRQIRTLLSALDTPFLLRLSSELEKHRDIRLTCVLRHRLEAAQLAQELQPDVLLMDSSVHNQHRTSLLETLRATCAHTKVMLFFDDDAEDPIIDALEHGVRGCLLKSCLPEYCARAIRAVHAGDMWVGRRALAHLLENLRARVEAASGPAADTMHGLTLREAEVVLKIKLGMTNKEVARQLGISETTVKTHLQHVFHKLHISRRVELWRGAPASAPDGIRITRWDDPATEVLHVEDMQGPVAK